MPLHRRIIAGCLLLCASMLAPVLHAEQPSSLPAVSDRGITAEDYAAFPEVLKMIKRADLQSALATLQSESDQHENDPAFFNLVGTLALKIRDYAAATVAFERVVLMQPDNAGAWMDLAIASAEGGNSAIATSYFDHIESTFAPPPALRAVIAHYRARLVQLVQAPYGWTVQAEVFAGFDSNANSGLQNSSIPLTVGAERIDLTLDSAYRARSDHFIQSAANLNFKHQLDKNLFEFSASAKRRDFQHEHDYSTLELNVGAGLRRAVAIGDLSVVLNSAHLSLGDKSLVRTTRTAVQLEHDLGPCRIGVASEGEWRRYIYFETLDANITWLQTGLSCGWKIRNVPLQTTFLTRTGIDKPLLQRPGGQSRLAESIAQMGVPFAWGIYGQLSYTVAQVKDSEGYSPLLELNAPRQIDRHSLRIALTRSLPSLGGEVFAAFENNHVLSNLPLFQQAGRIVGIGFRKLM